jgi:tetratricopeptide (TPR) repeat protein
MYVWPWSASPARPRLFHKSIIAALAVLAVAAIWAATSLLPKPDPEDLWVRAETAFRAGKWTEARTTLHQIEDLRTKTGRDWLLQAQLESAYGRTDEALAALAHVPGTDPLSGQSELMAGRLERARHRAIAAETHFRRALTYAPNLIDAHRELIHIYGTQSRRHEVDAEFRSLASLTSLTHHDLFTWELTHFTSWSPDVADDLQKFLDADPSDRYSRLALAAALVDQPGQAVRVAQLLDALPTTDPDALELRVALALQQGNQSEAERLLCDGPKNHAGLARFRGRLAMLRKDLAAAIGHFRIALSDEPYDRVSIFDLAQALRLSGEEKAVEPLTTRARQLNEVYSLVIRVRYPDRANEPPDLLRLGDACATAGLLDEARGWYLLAVRRDPLDARAQKGLYAVEHRGDAGR